MASRRRFPPPWKVAKGTESYVATDAAGQRLAYVYFENEPIRQGIMKRISRDDAYQLARAITRIRALLSRLAIRRLSVHCTLALPLGCATFPSRKVSAGRGKCLRQERLK
jgi:hypothetical protein